MQCGGRVLTGADGAAVTTGGLTIVVTGTISNVKLTPNPPY